MGQLYDARLALEKAIKEKHLDPFKIKGQIGLRVGMIISSIQEATPDNADLLKKLSEAARDILNVEI